MKLGKNPLFEPSSELFLIPDIHASFDELSSLWENLKQIIKKDDHLVFLGDYLGKSLNNIKTIKLLQEIKNIHNNTFFIEGNHESSLLSFLKSSNKLFFLEKKELDQEILLLGYSQANKQTYLDFFKENKITFLFELLPYYETKNILITHAPIDKRAFKYIEPYEGVLDTMSYELLWGFIDSNEEDHPVNGIDKWLICGHQNNEGKRNEPSIYPEVKRIFLDTGVGYIQGKKLHCFSFKSKKNLKF